MSSLRTSVRQIFLFGLLLSIACSFVDTSSLADNKVKEKIGVLAQGLPSFIGQYLPQSSYVSFKVKKLAKAKVIWINIPLLREMGINVPPEGMTEAFEREILQAFGYLVPAEQDSPDIYSDQSETFYADRYGGSGLGSNFGSARAGVKGKVQIKGIGLTPALGSYTHPENLDGGLTLEKSLREVIWSEINHRLLPFDSNRVIAVLDTGTVTRSRDGTSQRRSLLVRLDPIRFAHYLRAQYGTGNLAVSETERVKNAQEWLSRGLPVPKGEEPKEELVARINQGIVEFIERIAQQYATAEANGIFHGATSPSNMGLHGDFLDFETETAQPGYGPIQVLEHVAPFPDRSAAIEVHIKEVMSLLIKDLPDNIKQGLISPEELIKKFNTSYELRLKHELLFRAGTPPEFLEGTKTEPELESLSSLLKRLISTEGLQPIILDDDKMPEKTGRYDVRAILQILASSDHENREKLDDSLKTLIQETGLRTELIEAEINYRGWLTSSARQKGITQDSIFRYRLEAVEMRTRPLEDLYRANMLRENRRVIDHYLETGDRSEFAKSVHERVNKNYTSVPAPTAFQAVMEYQEDPTGSIHLYRVFDSRIGKEKMVLRLKSGQKVHSEFFGKIINADLILSAGLSNTEGEIVAKSTQRGDWLDFEFESTETAEFHQIRLVSAEDKMMSIKEVSLPRSVPRTVVQRMKCFSKSLMLFLKF